MAEKVDIGSLRSAAYVPTAEDYRQLEEHVLAWSSLVVPDIRMVRTPEEVSDAGLRKQILKRRNIKGWYDALGCETVVYLPNLVADGHHMYANFERVLFHEVVEHGGLLALLGEGTYGHLCTKVWDAMYEADRNTYINLTLGDPDIRSDRIAAAAEFIERTAESLGNRDYPGWEKAFSRWIFIMERFHETVGESWGLRRMSRNDLTFCLASALRKRRRMKKYNVPTLPLENLNRIVNDEIVGLTSQFRGAVRRDFDMTFKLGRIPNVLLHSSPRVRDLPMEIRTAALFGSDEDDKLERHPYRASDLKDLLLGLHSPLAVFNSKQVDKDTSVVVLLDNRSTSTGDGLKHFVAPMTPLVNSDGYAVMNIDSVYPKNDIQIFYWITKLDQNTGRPRFLRYVREDFLKAYLEPAASRMTHYYERKIREKLEEKAESFSKWRSNSAKVDEELKDLQADYEKVKSQIVLATNVVNKFYLGKELDLNPGVPGNHFRLVDGKDLYDRDKALDEGVLRAHPDPERTCRTAGFRPPVREREPVVTKLRPRRAPVIPGAPKKKL